MIDARLAIACIYLFFLLCLVLLYVLNLAVREARRWEKAYKLECGFSDHWRRECFKLADIDPNTTGLP